MVSSEAHCATRDDSRASACVQALHAFFPLYPDAAQARTAARTFEGLSPVSAPGGIWQGRSTQTPPPSCASPPPPSPHAAASCNARGSAGAAGDAALPPANVLAHRSGSPCESRLRRGARHACVVQHAPGGGCWLQAQVLAGALSVAEARAQACLSSHAGSSYWGRLRRGCTIRSIWRGWHACCRSSRQTSSWQLS